MVHSAELCDKIIKTQITLKMSSPFVMFNWFTFWVAWEWSLKAISNNFIENVRHMNGQSPCNAPEWLGGRKPPVPQGVLDKCERCSCWSCLKSLCGWSHSIIFEETSQFTQLHFREIKLFPPLIYTEGAELQPHGSQALKMYLFQGTKRIWSRNTRFGGIYQETVLVALPA